MCDWGHLRLWSMKCIHVICNTEGTGSRSTQPSTLSRSSRAHLRAHFKRCEINFAISGAQEQFVRPEAMGTELMPTSNYIRVSCVGCVRHNVGELNPRRSLGSTSFVVVPSQRRRRRAYCQSCTRPRCARSKNPFTE